MWRSCGVSVIFCFGVVFLSVGFVRGEGNGFDLGDSLVFIFIGDLDIRGFWL